VGRIHTSLLIGAVVVCGACSRGPTDSAASSSEDGVRIASFDFAESELLAELYAQALERVEVPVTRLGVVGPREIVAPSLELDRIDLVPEYLGTALQYFATADSQDIDSTTASSVALQQLLAPHGLVVLDAAAAQDANAIFVRSDFAKVGNIVTIGDLSGRSAELRFGGPVECPDRPLCLIGLSEVYGLEFAEFVPQRSVAITAEALRRDEIDVGLAFTTSPELDDDTFTILDDDMNLQPLENVVPVIRQSALDRWGPAARDALDELSVLTTTELRAMNRLVSDGSSMSEVVANWLAEHTRVDD
jgi:osmoprotectant transport system substrate-binding protein